MKPRWIRRVAAATLLTLGLGTGCGYYLHPERRGNSGGGVDGATLVMDLLWLLPGIIPGVIALVVDFSSGAIYVGHGRRAAMLTPPDGRVAVRLPASAKPMKLELRLVSSTGRVLARRTASIGPGLQDQAVVLQIAESVRPKRNETIYIEVAAAAGAARLPAPVAVAR